MIYTEIELICPECASISNFKIASYESITRCACCDKEVFISVAVNINKIEWNDTLLVNDISVVKVTGGVQ